MAQPLRRQLHILIAVLTVVVSAAIAYARARPILSTSAGLVKAVFTELQQVVRNFSINAEQAILHADATERRVVIRTGDRDGWAWIEVEDSGPGVPAEHEAKLFQPFYTTKPVGEGTGLGLSVSYDIIRAYDGRIGYRRGSMGGAVFFFELPIVTPEKLDA